MSRARINEIGELVFEDPVKHAEWEVSHDGSDVAFSTGEGDNLWMRVSDAAAVGDWLRRTFAAADWRRGNIDPAHPPSIPLTNEQCIYCGAADHEIANTTIGKVMACPQMPAHAVITVTPRIAEALRIANAYIDDDGRRVAILGMPLNDEDGEP